LANKIKDNNAIGVVFVGDGTLGQGVVYETMNIISKWAIPLLIVCENNKYAQSTSQEQTLAGSIIERAKAFDINTYYSNTWDVKEILINAKKSIDFVRETKKPAFHLVDTYRLGPHSKGDDYRDKDEIEMYRLKDPIEIFAKNNSDEYEKIVDKINNDIQKVIRKIETEEELSIEQYYCTKSYKNRHVKWSAIKKIEKRQVELINNFFDDYLAKDKNMIFIGEDVLSPYGGAFKVAKGLSDKYPDQVFATPISEQAITGIANGLALAGMKPYLEIMFGDFITLSMDQIINHASKFYHMYNKQVTCPVVIRTPMGGGRGYGPTHSQTLDKFLVGIDNVKVVALNNFISPYEIYIKIHTEEHPVIVIENKCDYGRKIATNSIKNYLYEKSDDDYPLIRLRPIKSTPTATLVTYGGMADVVHNCLKEIFIKLDIKSEVFILTLIHPLDIKEIVKSVENTGRLYVIEEGSAFAGIGSEIIAAVKEQTDKTFLARRIASLPLPIPSAKGLESEVITNKKRILQTIEETIKWLY